MPDNPVSSLVSVSRAALRRAGRRRERPGARSQHAAGPSPAPAGVHLAFSNSGHADASGSLTRKERVVRKRLFQEMIMKIMIRRGTKGITFVICLKRKLEARPQLPEPYPFVHPGVRGQELGGQGSDSGHGMRRQRMSNPAPRIRSPQPRLPQILKPKTTHFSLA